MDDPAKKAIGAPFAAAAQPVAEADEFAAIPRPRTRHPLLAAGAGVLALFLVAKMRADLTYFLAPRTAAHLGDARELLASDRGRAVLAEGTNHLVRVHGTPDRESALQVDTKGSWTFTQFFKILGTDSHLFIHRREDPLPGFRAESDVFEGRLLRFSDLSFEDAIRAYFAGHVSSTHFFSALDLKRALPARGGNRPVVVRDLAGDSVTLGPNDIFAIDLGHPGEVEVALPTALFATPEAARAALAARGATAIRPGKITAERQTFIVTIPATDRDRVLDAIGEIDTRAGIHDARETVKARFDDLVIDGDGLAILGTAGEPGVAATKRVLNNIETIRTLATVQIPPDAYLIVEAETPRDHLPDVAIALTLLVFATVNLVGLGKSLRR